MSFQAYLDTVAKQTGKSADDFHALAAERGLLDPGTKAGTVTAWLKADYGLGHGHAMAVYKAITSAAMPPMPVTEQIAAQFRGRRQVWRPVYDQLWQCIGEFGADVEVQATTTYLSLLRGGRKFAIIAVTGARMDIGLKLAGEAPLTPAGTWNSMVTHRMAIEDPADVVDEVVSWLHRAYQDR